MINKMTLFSILLGIIYCGNVHNNKVSDDLITVTSQEIDTVKVITDIRNEFAYINKNIANFKKTENDIITEEASEGGHLTAYFENGDVRKVIEEYYGDIGKIVYEYYFKNEKVFFIFVQEFFYDKPMVFEDYKVDKIEENRYYLYNDNLIRWLDKNKQKVPSNIHVYKEKEKNLIKDVNKIKENLN